MIYIVYEDYTEHDIHPPPSPYFSLKNLSSSNMKCYSHTYLSYMYVYCLSPFLSPSNRSWSLLSFIKIVQMPAIVPGT